MRIPLLAAAVIAAAPSASAAAELRPETTAAYEHYITAFEERFDVDSRGSLSIEHTPAETLRRLRAGDVLSWAGHGDGILDAPHGLVHHWRAAIFIPGTTLETVLAVSRDYPSYPRTYPWIVQSARLGHEAVADPRLDRYRVRLRMKRRTRMITTVVDFWALVEYRYPAADRAVASSDADCVREVENEGKRNERLMPAGQGGGYLWRANTYATYLERDGGVYVDFHTLGLSRDFPPLLGWLIEPIARRIGRGSATETLKELRRAVVERGRQAPSDAVEPVTPDTAGERPWCGGE